ncbi:hypothetical protein, conserved [Entamoeba dispar SAW760]|uniref:Leucine rich repeat containing protein BspA family protein n=1 Tax=Entamoeba dispar (strain ATCC PRA-260 / SAW760) TaxID=370354 RepID=B0E7Q1_ENTDS|nr:uncharacterized protein EDI_014550 [Entamoeba dispar SAW760]EDR29445.1 hypothetical protein, conserved [Entamoeba dispar SAW760]|eukprot:EDR29445.1 hypothetical protein, conserved [Entamoeba dispar SAW760]
MKLGYNEIMIVSKYFNKINDFINLEIGIKRFQGNIERFHFNPIPLNKYSRKLFPNIETFHIYNKKDKVFNDGKIFKKIIWYEVDYSTYLKEKEKWDVYKNIRYTQLDRMKYGEVIPQEVTSIGYQCFDWCIALTRIDIPSRTKELSGNCFNGCKSLKSITIPSTISTIGFNCFYWCTSLTSINNQNIQFISKERIFMNEPVLVSIETPKNIQIINGKNIEKKDINEFIIPPSITKLGEYCFSGCSTLTSITIPSSINEIGYSCFSSCSSLKSINIPSSVSKLEDYCFNYCKSLTSIIIPSSINEIGGYCFSGCSSLQSINIPSSITAFGTACFYECGCEEMLKQNKTIPENCFQPY